MITITLYANSIITPLKTLERERTISITNYRNITHCEIMSFTNQPIYFPVTAAHHSIRATLYGFSLKARNHFSKETFREAIKTNILSLSDRLIKKLRNTAFILISYSGETSHPMKLQASQCTQSLHKCLNRYYRTITISTATAKSAAVKYMYENQNYKI